MKIIFEYFWMMLLPMKILLQEFDFVFYLLIGLTALFVASKLFLKYEIRLLYPDFFKDTDTMNKTIH